MPFFNISGDDFGGRSKTVKIILFRVNLGIALKALKNYTFTQVQYNTNFRKEHSLAPKDLTNNFSILKKCTTKFDFLIFEMFFIHELRPSLNVQSDSIRAKVFK